MTRGRYQAARATRMVFGRNNYNLALESVVDPERQLELSRERRANLVLAEVLYSNNRITVMHRVYQHYSEQRILCANDDQTNLSLCNQQSYQSLRTSGLQHIHLGIFMIRLHALHRRSAECTREMKQLAAAALYSVEEVLQSPYAFKKNIKITCKERAVAQDIELSVAKEVVKAMRSLQAIIQCKAQICFEKSTKDNHWSDQREDVRIQNKEARRILVELEALAHRLGRYFWILFYLLLVNAITKLLLEALRVCEESVRVVRPNIKVSDFDFKPYICPLNNAIMPRLTNQDQDQEAKECAISCMGLS
ncbi:Orf y [Tanacetum coccineum]